MSREDWLWMPHVAHFIGGHECLFRLATYVPSGYIVSTVGEWCPGGKWSEPWESLGSEQKYETMVFHAKESKYKCCLYEIKSGMEIETDRYDDAESAREGHMTLCEKYDREES